MTQESGIQSLGMRGLQELINLLIPWAHNKELAHCSPAPGAMFVVSAAAVCRPGLISRSMSVLPLCWRHRQWVPSAGALSVWILVKVIVACRNSFKVFHDDSTAAHQWHSHQWYSHELDCPFRSREGTWISQVHFTRRPNTGNTENKFGQNKKYFVL